MKASLIVLSLFIGTQAWAATVYRAVNEEGYVQYSDRPNSEGAEEVTIRIQRPAGTATRTAAATDQAAQDDATSEAGGSEQQLAEEAARRTERRAENCTIARERLERYAISHRLYRPLPNGEREYLSDPEIDEARANAAADVNEWCG